MKKIILFSLIFCVAVPLYSAENSIPQEQATTLIGQLGQWILGGISNLWSNLIQPERENISNNAEQKSNSEDKEIEIREVKEPDTSPPQSTSNQTTTPVEVEKEKNEDQKNKKTPTVKKGQKDNYTANQVTTASVGVAAPQTENRKFLPSRRSNENEKPEEEPFYPREQDDEVGKMFQNLLGGISWDKDFDLFGQWTENDQVQTPDTSNLPGINRGSMGNGGGITVSSPVLNGNLTSEGQVTSQLPATSGTSAAEQEISQPSSSSLPESGFEPSEQQTPIRPDDEKDKRKQGEKPRLLKSTTPETDSLEEEEKRKKEKEEEKEKKIEEVDLKEWPEIFPPTLPQNYPPQERDKPAPGGWISWAAGWGKSAALAVGSAVQKGGTVAARTAINYLMGPEASVPDRRKNPQLYLPDETDLVQALDSGNIEAFSKIVFEMEHPDELFAPIRAINDQTVFEQVVFLYKKYGRSDAFTKKAIQVLLSVLPIERIGEAINHLLVPSYKEWDAKDISLARFCFESFSEEMGNENYTRQAFSILFEKLQSAFPSNESEELYKKLGKDIEEAMQQNYSSMLPETSEEELSLQKEKEIKEKSEEIEQSIEEKRPQEMPTDLDKERLLEETSPPLVEIAQEPNDTPASQIIDDETKFLNLVEEYKAGKVNAQNLSQQLEALKKINVEELQEMLTSELLNSLDENINLLKQFSPYIKNEQLKEKIGTLIEDAQNQKDPSQTSDPAPDPQPVTPPESLSPLPTPAPTTTEPDIKETPTTEALPIEEKEDIKTPTTSPDSPVDESANTSPETQQPAEILEEISESEAEPSTDFEQLLNKLNNSQTAEETLSAAIDCLRKLMVMPEEQREQSLTQFLEALKSLEEPLKNKVIAAVLTVCAVNQKAVWMLEAFARDQKLENYLNSKDKKERTFLLLAIEKQAVSCAKFFLEKVPLLLSQPDAKGKTALHYAVAVPLKEIVEQILEMDEEKKLVNARSEKGETPFMACCLAAAKNASSKNKKTKKSADGEGHEITEEQEAEEERTRYENLEFFEVAEALLKASSLKELLIPDNEGKNIFMFCALFPGTYSETLPFLIYNPLGKMEKEEREGYRKRLDDALWKCLLYLCEKQESLSLCEIFFDFCRKKNMYEHVQRIAFASLFSGKDSTVFKKLKNLIPLVDEAKKNDFKMSEIIPEGFSEEQEEQKGRARETFIWAQTVLENSKDEKLEQDEQRISRLASLFILVILRYNIGNQQSIVKSFGRIKNNSSAAVAAKECATLIVKTLSPEGSV